MPGESVKSDILTSLEGRSRDGQRRHATPGSSFEFGGSIIFRIWEATKVLRKFISAVVGHNSKNKLCIHLMSCENQLRPS